MGVKVRDIFPDAVFPVFMDTIVIALLGCLKIA